MGRVHKLFSYLAALLAASLFFGLGQARAFDVVFNAQWEYLDAYYPDFDQQGNPVGNPKPHVFIDPDPPEPTNINRPARVGRHVNGQMCFFPPNAPKAFKNKFVISDDTYREACVETDVHQPRCDITNHNTPQYVGKDPDGWGVFKDSDGTWAGSVIHVDGFSCDKTAKTCVQPQGTVDPQGCAFDSHANLWGTDVGNTLFAPGNGALLVFFASTGYKEYCFVATDLASPGMLNIQYTAVPGVGGMAIYVPEPGSGKITKFVGSFPEKPEDCHIDSASGKPVANVLPIREPILTVGALTPTAMIPVPLTNPASIALPSLDPIPAPGSIPVSETVESARIASWYVASALLPPSITEYNDLGIPLKPIVLPGVPLNPLGMATGSDGTLYYAELNLDLSSFNTGCGRMSMVKFDELGVPQQPVVLSEGLAFPDGVGAFDSSRFKLVQWNDLPSSTGIDVPTLGCATE